MTPVSAGHIILTPIQPVGNATARIRTRDLLRRKTMFYPWDTAPWPDSANECKRVRKEPPIQPQPHPSHQRQSGLGVKLVHLFSVWLSHQYLGPCDHWEHDEGEDDTQGNLNRCLITINASKNNRQAHGNKQTFECRTKVSYIIKIIWNI
ncbi:hypothetical protein EGW08_018870 [Elysia chlorotica]|uniref:Uncharacterized protein n=1 Tax=Elysia chlorotica TaxID=188477 RepID=A0A3S0ZAN0_ELYCH|nr:hypothetical protein EGW08_018870 [Elysia chlorotica]